MCEIYDNNRTTSSPSTASLGEFVCATPTGKNKQLENKQGSEQAAPRAASRQLYISLLPRDKEYRVLNALWLAARGLRLNSQRSESKHASVLVLHVKRGPSLASFCSLLTTNKWTVIHCSSPTSRATDKKSYGRNGAAGQQWAVTHCSLLTTNNIVDRYSLLTAHRQEIELWTRRAMAEMVQQVNSGLLLTANDSPSGGAGFAKVVQQVNSRPFLTAHYSLLGRCSLLTTRH